VFSVDGSRSYPAAIRELKAEGEYGPVAGTVVAPVWEQPHRKSDHRHVKRRLRAMRGPRTAATAWAVIQGIEAAQMIRKGQVLGTTRQNRHGQAWVFGSLLGVA
jgi:IS6 family transposase